MKRVSALLISVVALSFAVPASAEITIRQLQRLDHLVSTKDCQGLYNFVRRYREVTYGNDPLAVELAQFLKSGEQGDLQCVVIDRGGSMANVVASVGSQVFGQQNVATRNANALTTPQVLVQIQNSNAQKKALSNNTAVSPTVNKTPSQTNSPTTNVADNSSPSPSDNSSQSPSTPSDNSPSTPSDNSSSTPSDNASSTPSDNSSSSPSDNSSSPSDNSSSSPSDNSSSSSSDNSSSSSSNSSSSSSSSSSDSSSSSSSDSSSSSSSDNSSSSASDSSSSSSSQP